MYVDSDVGAVTVFDMYLDSEVAAVTAFATYVDSEVAALTAFDMYVDSEVAALMPQPPASPAPADSPVITTSPGPPETLRAHGHTGQPGPGARACIA